MKNIHILPTNEISKIYKDDFGKLIFSLNIDPEQNHFKPQHIYITNNEEPKKDEKPVDFRREIDNAYASKEAAYTKGGLDPNQAAINNAAAEKAAADKAKEEAAARAAGIAAREAARR